MKKFTQIIFSFLIFAICYDKFTLADLPCGDWTPYKEEKCIMIFDNGGLKTYEDAEKTCQQQANNSILITVHLQEEQDFISNLLFKTHSVVDNIWIGAKYTIDKFKWSDGSDLVYTNWANGSPKNKADLCVQLNSDETMVGKWSDVPCSKKNLVVCEKLQTLSLAELQRIIFDVKKNTVPIGFIYVQLPNEKFPAEIWPWMVWNDVSSSYAGVFFRVSGGEAALFGQVQNDSAPYISSIEHCRDCSSPVNSIPITRSTGWSEYVSSAKSYSAGGGSDGLKFYTSGGEVRPRNMAMHVWKRTG